MREIILDTETTGLDPAKGDRLVEIGAIELMNHLPTGATFHRFINPERDVPAEASAVHGLTSEFLRSHPIFSDVVEDFLQFIGTSRLIIHNASFDVGFINAELAIVKREAIGFDRVVDTLKLARQKHPMGPNSLDALCRRYGIDNSKRSKHGALLDSELLAQVYLELIGGRQTVLSLPSGQARAKSGNIRQSPASKRVRPVELPQRLTADEQSAHAVLVHELGSAALWIAEKGKLN